jgi:hypothetical protein
VSAIATLAYLEALQRFRQGRPQVRLDVHAKFPGYVDAPGSVTRKVLDPVHKYTSSPTKLHEHSSKVM